MFVRYKFEDGVAYAEMHVQYGHEPYGKDRPITVELWTKAKVAEAANNPQYIDEARRRYVKILMDWPYDVRDLEDDALCAARWRALMSSQRVRIVGAAGFQVYGDHMPPFNHYHLGMEFWNVHPAAPDQSGRAFLTNYADLLTTQDKS